MKRNFNRHVAADKIKWTIVFLLIVVLIAGFIGMALVLNKQVKTREIGPSAYEIGCLDATGNYEKDVSAIYTDKFITVDGLTCELAEDAQITYELFFFDKKEKFISSTGALSGDWNDSAPTTAVYVKIVITPTDDAEVTWIEVRGYAKQLTVTVNR